MFFLQDLNQGMDKEVAVNGHCGSDLSTTLFDRLDALLQFRLQVLELFVVGDSANLGCAQRKVLTSLATSIQQNMIQLTIKCSAMYSRPASVMSISRSSWASHGGPRLRHFRAFTAATFSLSTLWPSTSF